MILLSALFYLPQNFCSCRQDLLVYYQDSIRVVDPFLKHLSRSDVDFLLLQLVFQRRLTLSVCHTAIFHKLISSGLPICNIRGLEFLGALVCWYTIAKQFFNTHVLLIDLYFLFNLARSSPRRCYRHRLLLNAYF